MEVFSAILVALLSWLVRIGCMEIYLASFLAAGFMAGLVGLHKSPDTSFFLTPCFITKATQLYPQCNYSRRLLSCVA